MITEITKEILKISEAIRNKKISELSGDDISRAIVRLSVLRVNLGQELAASTGEYDLSYIARKIQYASDYKKNKETISEKLTQKDLDSITILTMGDLMQKEIELKKTADSLKILYESTGTLVSSLQSRLSILKQERMEVKHYESNL